MEHDEFPLLTEPAHNVFLKVAGHRMDISKPGWNRRFAAAVIREAVRQAGPFTIGTGIENEVVRASTLITIADNLHAVPPIPPTREKLEYALKRVSRLVDCQEGSEVGDCLEILRAGIAHHCKVQP